MDANVVMTAIGTLGFPIVACCAMFWDRQVDRKERTAESNKFTEAINNNTLAMTKLIDRIDCK